MIVRVLGEGQYELADEDVERIESLDATLSQALTAGDEASFARALETLVGELRQRGRPLEPEKLVPSDLAIPPEGSTIAEVRALLDEDTPEKA